MTDEEKKAAEADEAAKTPPTIKIGDKEYTASEIQALEEAKAKTEEEKALLQSDYTKKAQRLAELEKLQEKVDDIKSGSADASDLTAAELEDLKYFRKLGFLPKEEHEKILEEKLAAKEKELEEKETKREMRIRVEKEIDELATKHDFVKKDELAKFLSDKADAGAILTTDEAFTLLYKDVIIANNVKPEELPGVDKTSKAEAPTKTDKVFELGSREMNAYLKERLTQPKVE